MRRTLRVWKKRLGQKASLGMYVEARFGKLFEILNKVLIPMEDYKSPLQLTYLYVYWNYTTCIDQNLNSHCCTLYLSMLLRMNKIVQLCFQTPLEYVVVIIIFACCVHNRLHFVCRHFLSTIVRVQSISFLLDIGSRKPISIKLTKKGGYGKHTAECRQSHRCGPP